jgi:glycosyltransferase involved in cell wall biosynthesis
MDYMMAGRPVVIAIDVENSPVDEARCGITVSPGDSVAVAQAVLRLTSLTAKERAAMGQSGREFILKHQTYRALAMRFLDEIGKIPTDHYAKRNR